MTDCLLSPGFHASLTLGALGETRCGAGTDLCCSDTRHTFAGFLRYTLQASSIWTFPRAGLHLITVILIPERSKCFKCAHAGTTGLLLNMGTSSSQ